MKDDSTIEKKLDEIFGVMNGWGEHACYCSRSLDKGCECAIATEYVTDAKAAITALVKRAEIAARIDELTRQDNTFPNWWKTGQSEYTAKDMEKLGDYHIKRIEELQAASASNQRGGE